MTANSAAQSRDHGASAGVGSIQGAVDQVKGKIAEAQDEITERAGEAVETAEKYVGDYPWKSLAIAGSIGIVLGMLIGRR